MAAPARRWVRIAMPATLGLAAFATIAGAIVALDIEADVAAAQRRLEVESSGWRRGETPTGFVLIDHDAPPRAALPDAVRLSQAAAAMADPERRAAMLDRASATIGRVESARAYWGDAAVAQSFVAAQRGGIDDSRTIDALERSYRATPFLRAAAAWRVNIGVAAWDRVAPTTRHAIVAEAVWLSRFSPEDHNAVFTLMRRSAAYQPFLLEWRRLRATDA